MEQHLEEHLEKRGKTFFAFNTINQLSIWGEDAGQLEQLLDELMVLSNHYELLFSHTAPNSGLTRLNQSLGKPVQAASELVELTSASLRYAEATAGLFDPTMGSVIRLWDFNSGHIPSRDEISDGLKRVGYYKLLVEDNTLRFADALVALNLGGIAKGYIADKMLELLRERGLTNAIINLGGNVAVLGARPDGSAWRVGLRTPQLRSSQETESPHSPCFATVEVSDSSVVTSGIYERAFVHDGRLYHHILDPKTGWPAQTDLLSASLIAKHSLDADGYTTALIVMGLDKALEFVEGQPGLEAVFVSSSGEVFATSGIGTNIPFKLE